MTDPVKIRVLRILSGDYTAVRVEQTAWGARYGFDITDRAYLDYFISELVKARIIFEEEE